MFSLFRKTRVALLTVISVMVITSPAWAATYYVDATNGNDANAGTSTSAPWKAVAKVNATAFKPGDSVLFKRGETWRGAQLRLSANGAAGAPITVGAYGAGNKPRLFYSVDKSKTTDWTNEGGNIWSTPVTCDIGIVVFNNEGSAGNLFRNSTGVNAQGKCYSRNPKFYLYSVSNPASYYTHIECGLNDLTGDGTKASAIRDSGSSYHTYQDLDVRYAGNLGVNIKSGANNIIFERCDFSWIGGGYQGTAGRIGNAVQYWYDAHDCIVRYCTFNQIYDTAITPQYSGTPTAGGHFTNLFFYYNIINNCEYSYEFWYKDKSAVPTSSCDNIRFENNVCLNAGSSWGHSQRPDPSGRHLMFFSNYAAMTNIFIRNNIFYGAKQSCLYRYSTTFTDWANFTIDNNCYYMAPGTDSKMIYFPTASYGMAQFASYQSAQKLDLHSKAADPLFVNPAGDFHLSVGSPCIGAGANAGLARDFDGLAVSGAAVDIGAFAYAPPVVAIAPPSNLRIQ